MRAINLRTLSVLTSTLLATSAALGQTEALSQEEVVLEIDTGLVWNTSDARGVASSTVVHVPDSPWLRLVFSEVTLGAAAPGGENTILRITSLHDGAVQVLDATRLTQWQYTSAYFNGDTLLLEIIADPTAAASRATIGSAFAGVYAPEESICGSVDDRLPSEDPRVARQFPDGCSVWLIDDASNCMLTAGHCDHLFGVIEFNVPLSSSNGTPQHPGPQDQYPVDMSSIQSNGGQGTGNDWAYFGCFANTETGLTAGAAQGDFFVLADEAPAQSGQQIRITGFGTTSSPIPPEWDQAQKTHVGPYVSLSGNTLNYMTDTTGGNSGSPVILEDTGEAIGIHTHGGCNSVGSNRGTAVQHPGLQDALADPIGVCLAGPENNHCADAITVGEGTTMFTNIFATTDGPAEECGGEGDFQISSDVWFKYSSPVDAEVTVQLCGSTFDTKMAVYYHGCPSVSGIAVACNDDACGTSSSVTFDATAGLAYRIRIGGLQGAEGDGVMNIAAVQSTPCPGDTNDDGVVDVNDLLNVILDWQTDGSANGGDANNDGTVNVSDLVEVVLAWGDC